MEHTYLFYTNSRIDSHETYRKMHQAHHLLSSIDRLRTPLHDFFSFIIRKIIEINIRHFHDHLRQLVLQRFLCLSDLIKEDDYQEEIILRLQTQE